MTGVTSSVRHDTHASTVVRWLSTDSPGMDRDRMHYRGVLIGCEGGNVKEYQLLYLREATNDDNAEIAKLAGEGWEVEHVVPPAILGADAARKGASSPALLFARRAVGIPTMGGS